MMHKPRMILVSFLLLICFPFIANAKPIVADLAIHSIDIDHDFTGIDILMFGAKNDIGKIVVVVRGPERKYIVRKKERVVGIWANSESMDFKNVPGFYSIAETNKLEEINNNTLLSTLGIGVENLNFQTHKNEAESAEFKDAIIRNKQLSNLYSKDSSKITFWGETLFRTSLKFPKNIEGGWYTAEVYLFNDGQLSSVQSTPLLVRKTGFEAYMFDLAHKHSAFYGILCVLMAILAGWTANVMFGKR